MDEPFYVVGRRFAAGGPHLSGHALHEREITQVYTPVWPSGTVRFTARCLDCALPFPWSTGVEQ